jgi:hypothetical protein
MPNLSKTLIAVAVTLVVAIGIVGWLLYQTYLAPAPVVVPTPDVAETPQEPESFMTQAVIGRSVEGRPIEAYEIGTGPTDLLLVGGIHGGYEWNSTLLAWEMIDYYGAAPGLVPENVTLHIIPVLNPDGLALVVGTSSRFVLSDVPSPSSRVAAGRFNANSVDLNRNFDCNWAPESTWRGNVVSAGTAPFSEPEAAALRDYVTRTQPEAAAFWHSQANNVYGSACNSGVLPLTSVLGAAYAEAGNYGFVELFDAYPITGDVEGWLASIGIPAVTVELETFNQTEWERNLAGVETWLTYFAAQTEPAR